MKNSQTDQKIRCFIAIQLPDDVRHQISKYIENLKKYSNDVRWVRADNSHLTLKFLGEIAPSRLIRVKECLYPISDNFSPFHLNIFGTGCFPGKKHPRVFWLGMEQGVDNPLFEMHHWIENQLLKLKFEKEKRRFSPHLTLGRVRAKGLIDFSELFSFLEQNPFRPTKFSVNTIYFMQSNLRPTGAEYHVIEKYSLNPVIPAITPEGG
jgi:2'-5' RNA ligase